MQQLSSQDASFLHLESQQSPMHIGCILTFAAPNSGKMTFERFQRHIVSRLPSSPVFRRRLSRLPLDLDRPYWVEDGFFDIENHLQQAQIHGEDSENQRAKLINHFFSRPLNLAYPLWEILFIDHSDDEYGEFSVLIKFHHAAIDGVSGEKILSGLMSTDADPGPSLDDTWAPEFPSLTRKASNRLKSLFRMPWELSAFSHQLGHAMKRSQQLRHRDKQQQPPHFFTSPGSPFNGQIDSTRHISSAHLSMATIKTIKNTHPGSTVNDVVLAVCAGALRKHLTSLGQLPESSMVAMVPVSNRQGFEKHQGNLISAMLVSLATDIDSPIERFEAIQQNSKKAKEYNREVAMEQVIDHLPSYSSSWLIKTYTRFRIARLLKPVFNLIITNVPGPGVPLYLDGAKLKSMEGMAPIVDKMGLTLVVTSYIDVLTIAVTTTAAMSNHASAFINALHESLDELHSALVPCAKNQPSNALAVDH